MPRISLAYRLSAEWQKRHLIETGQPQSEVRVEIEFEALTPPQREVFVAYFGTDWLGTISWSGYVPGLTTNLNGTQIHDLTLDGEVTADELLAIMAHNWPAYQCLRENIRQTERERDERRRRDDRESEASHERWLQAQQAANELRKREKGEWIEQNGSSHLKRAFSAGYDSQRLYVTERAAIEHPGWALDFKADFSFDDRTCPSEAALDIEDANPGSRTVWVSSRHDDDPEDFVPCEAVLIEHYLGRYALFFWTQHN